MNKLCTTCNLHTRIERHKLKLNNLIVDKNNQLLDKKIIDISQTLDELIYNCIFCNKNLNHISTLNLKDIFGTHSTFYYYGEQHLFTNMYFYITEGIKNNELIYLFMEENIYNRLLEFLKINDVPLEDIKFKSVKNLVQGNKQYGLDGLKAEINKIGSDEEVKKYKGIRWIGQPSYCIQCNSQEDFLNFETNLNEAVNNTNASLLCIYDAYDYMHKGEFINETVIEESLLTHSYILKNSLLEKIS